MVSKKGKDDERLIAWKGWSMKSLQYSQILADSNMIELNVIACGKTNAFAPYLFDLQASILEKWFPWLAGSHWKWKRRY